MDVVLFWAEAEWASSAKATRALRNMLRDCIGASGTRRSSGRLSIRYQRLAELRGIAMATVTVIVRIRARLISARHQTATVEKAMEGEMLRSASRGWERAGTDESYGIYGGVAFVAPATRSAPRQHPQAPATCQGRRGHACIISLPRRHKAQVQQAQSTTSIPYSKHR